MCSFQIRVNSVNPTVVLTPLAIDHGWLNPAKASRITERTPLGRLAGKAGPSSCVCVYICLFVNIEIKTFWRHSQKSSLAILDTIYCQHR